MACSFFLESVRVRGAERANVCIYKGPCVVFVCPLEVSTGLRLKSGRVRC